MVGRVRPEGRVLRPGQRRRRRRRRRRRNVYPKLTQQEGFIHNQQVTVG